MTFAPDGRVRLATLGNIGVVSAGLRGDADGNAHFTTDGGAGAPETVVDEARHDSVHTLLGSDVWLDHLTLGLALTSGDPLFRIGHGCPGNLRIARSDTLGER